MSLAVGVYWKQIVGPRFTGVTAIRAQSNTLQNSRIEPAYPSGILRAILRAPLLLYRLGLGGVVNDLHFTSGIVLTTRGRLSGEPRHAVLEYRRHGSKLYIISVWGDKAHWYQNIQQDPTVTVQEGRHVFRAKASVVTDRNEAMRALVLFRKVAPAVYDPLLAALSASDRVDAHKIPEISDQFVIVRLDEQEAPPLLPALPTDLKWVSALIVLFAFGALITGLVRRRRR